MSLLVNLFSSISSHLYKRDTYLCSSECTGNFTLFSETNLKFALCPGILFVFTAGQGCNLGLKEPVKKYGGKDGAFKNMVVSDKITFWG